jgi:hypothetical protein
VSKDLPLRSSVPPVAARYRSQGLELKGIRCLEGRPSKGTTSVTNATTAAACQLHEHTVAPHDSLETSGRQQSYGAASKCARNKSQILTGDKF